MEFFQQIAALNLKGTLKLVIGPAPEGLLVSVLLDDQNVTDQAKKSIPPLLLKGTPAEFDEQFFSALQTPIKQVAGLLTNMDTFQKGVDAANAASAIEKAKTEKVKKQADEAKKGYDAAMKKVTDLEAENKHREAYGKLPKATDFPAYADAINAKQAELRRKFSQGSLFDGLEDDQPAAIAPPEAAALQTGQESYDHLYEEPEEVAEFAD